MQNIWLCCRILIKGNYDVLTDDIYKGYFNVVADEFILNCTDIGAKFALAHKPEDLPPTYFGICGHVHSAWRIQRNIINVCMDANHYQLVSLDQILKTYNAIKTYHDRNAFAGELEANKRTAPL